MANERVINDLFELMPRDVRQAVYVLSVSSALTDPLASQILSQTKVANGNASEVIGELKEFPIWHRRTKSTWTIEQDVKKIALNKLNGTTQTTQRSVLKALRNHPTNQSIHDRKDLDLQTARLSLKIPSEMEKGVNKLRSMFNSAELYREQETTRVIASYLEESELGSKKGKWPKYVLSSYFIIGLNAYRRRESQKALQYLIPVWENHDETYEGYKDAAIAAHIIGLIWSRKRRKFKNAEEAYEDSIELLEEINDNYGLAQVYHSLGNLLAKEHRRFPDAEEAFQKSIEYERQNKNSYGLAQVYHSLGNLLSNEDRRFQDAEEAYLQSIKIGKEIQHSHHLAQVYHSLGNLLGKGRARFKNAEEAYLKSIELLAEINDNYGLAQVYHSLGNLLGKERRRYKDAKEAFQKSFDLRGNDKYGLAQSYHSLGKLLNKEGGQSKEAEEAYLKSIKIGKEINHSFHLALAYRSLGNLLSKNPQRFKEAEEAYSHSIKLGKEINQSLGLAQVYQNLGNLLSKDPQRYKDAEDAYLKSIKIGKEISHSFNLAQVYTDYGKLKRKQADFKKAKELFEEALKYRSDSYFIRLVEKMIRELPDG